MRNRKFRTIAAAAMALIMVLSLTLTGCGGKDSDYDPLEGVETQKVTAKWRAVPGASGYDVWIGTNSAVTKGLIKYTNVKGLYKVTKFLKKQNTSVMLSLCVKLDLYSKENLYEQQINKIHIHGRPPAQQAQRSRYGLFPVGEAFASGVRQGVSGDSRITPGNAPSGGTAFAGGRSGEQGNPGKPSGGMGGVF